jgi:hypothetical protein
VRFTFLTKDFGDWAVFTALDLFVEIDELPTGVSWRRRPTVLLPAPMNPMR